MREKLKAIMEDEPRKFRFLHHLVKLFPDLPLCSGAILVAKKGELEQAVNSFEV